MAKSDVRRVLLDSSALIAVIKDEPGASRLDGLFHMIQQGEAELVESVLVLAEVFKRSTSNDEAQRSLEDAKLENIRALLQSRDVMLLDVTPPVARKATEYRSEYGMKLPDAVHLATGVLNRCDWIVTLDNDFPDIQGVKIYRLSHLKDDSFQLPWDRGMQGALFADTSNVIQLELPKSP